MSDSEELEAALSDTLNYVASLEKALALAQSENANLRQASEDIKRSVKAREETAFAQGATTATMRALGTYLETAGVDSQAIKRQQSAAFRGGRGRGVLGVGRQSLAYAAATATAAPAPVPAPAPAPKSLQRSIFAREKPTPTPPHVAPAAASATSPPPPALRRPKPQPPPAKPASRQQAATPPSLPLSRPSSFSEKEALTRTSSGHSLVGARHSFAVVDSALTQRRVSRVIAARKEPTSGGGGSDSVEMQLAAVLSRSQMYDLPPEKLQAHLKALTRQLDKEKQRQTTGLRPVVESESAADMPTVSEWDSDSSHTGSSSEPSVSDTWDTADDFSEYTDGMYTTDTMYATDDYAARRRAGRNDDLLYGVDHLLEEQSGYTTTSSVDSRLRKHLGLRR